MPEERAISWQDYTGTTRGVQAENTGGTGGENGGSHRFRVSEKLRRAWANRRAKPRGAWANPRDKTPRGLG